MGTRDRFMHTSLNLLLIKDPSFFLRQLESLVNFGIEKIPISLSSTWTGSGGSSTF
jgi:hypothetical protein